MARIRNFVRRTRRHSRAEQLLFLRATLMLATMTVLVRLLPFPAIRRLFIDSAGRASVTAPDMPAAAVARAVRRASCYVPAAKCLPQALTAHWLLNRRGYPAALRLGATLDDQRRLIAHAWVELDGRVLIGGTDSTSRFAAFPPLRKEQV